MFFQTRDLFAKLVFPVLLAVTLLAYRAEAQLNNRHFYGYTLEDGLSQSAVSSITQDKNGYLWIGTSDGLNRFDGIRFETFYSSHYKQLHSSYINDLYIDTTNRLWIATNNGLHFYDIDADKFTLVPLANNKFLSTTTIAKDENNTLWIGTENGLFRLKQNKSTLIKIQELKNSGNRNNSITSLYATNTHIWVGTRMGLNKLNKQNHTNEFVDLTGDSSALYINKIFKDSQQNLWIASDSGLYVSQNANGNAFKKFRLHSPNINAAIITQTIEIKDITETSDGNLWIASAQSGLFLYNPYTKETDHYWNNIYFPLSLTTNRIQTLFESREGVLWVGTYLGGVNKHILSSAEFEHITANLTPKPGLKTKVVRTIYEDIQGQLWIGTVGGGVSIYNPQTTDFKNFSPQSAYKGIKLHSYDIRSIFTDSDGKMWFGSNENGLLIIDFDNKKTYQPIVKKNTAGFLQGGLIFSIIEDSNGLVWVSTYGGGVSVFEKHNPTTPIKTFRHDKNNRHSICDDRIYTLFEDSRKQIWAGSYDNGFSVMELDEFNTGFFRNYNIQNSNLSGNFILSFFEDTKNNIWAGTYGFGLNKIAPDMKIESFNSQNGLPSNVVYTINADKNGHLWLTTNKGIVAFDPVKLVFKTYDKSSGIQSNEFNGNAGITLKNGNIAVGGINGLSIFSPTTITSNQTEAIGIISAIIVNDSVRKIQITKDSDAELNLTYPQNNLNFELSALHLVNPQKNILAYKMQGLDNDWIYIGAENRYISYKHLKPGSYDFMIRSSNSNGVWSSQISRVKINISPPWWQKAWFVVFVILVAISFIVLYIHWREQKHIALQKKQEEIIAKRTTEIERQKKELEIANNELQKINSAKDKFLSILAHDLKNPFNALLGLSAVLENNFSDTPEKEKLQYIKLINHSAKDIFYMLENLLYWTRNQTSSLKAKLKPVALSPLLSRVEQIHQLMIEDKKINFSIACKSQLQVLADEFMLETILRNLLSNAIKFTPHNGSIQISCTAVSSTAVKISITDTGTGMSEATINHIIKPENAFSMIGTNQEKGTGLGLALSSEFLQLQNSRLQIDSQPKKGSSFYFVLNSVASVQ